MILSLPNDGTGHLYHVVNMFGHTVHAYRDKDAASSSLEGSQRIFTQVEATGEWLEGKPEPTPEIKDAMSKTIVLLPHQQRAVDMLKSMKPSDFILSMPRRHGQATMMKILKERPAKPEFPITTMAHDLIKSFAMPVELPEGSLSSTSHKSQGRTMEEVVGDAIQSDYLKYRGKCKEMSEALVAEDPTLTLVRGHYFCPIWNRDEPHWWCVKQDGTIVDPTARQFPSAGGGIYTPFNGMVACAECGKEVPEADAVFDSNYAFCSGKCNMRFVGL
jgi:hypothetical protein